jgi:FG-GAP-like repeat
MVSRRPFYAVLIIGLFGCDDSSNYPLPNDEPTKAPLPNDCVNPTVRNELGTQASGLKTIRVRARIATNGNGDLAVPTYRPAYDMRILNTRFASSNLRFILVDVETVPADEKRFQLTTLQNPLCDAEFAPLHEDAIPILYVDSIILTGRPHPGMANVCGAVYASFPKYATFGSMPGEYSDLDAVPIMMGYVLGLLPTHACYSIPGYEDDLQLSGDLVADTSFDPGSTLVEVNCGETKAPGKCSLVDEATCVVNCSDGSTPDVSNFMSSYRGCRERFSAGQGVYTRCAVELHHKGAKCNNVWAEGFGEKLDQSYNGPHIADVNGDGNADAILYEEFGPPATWRVALSNGSQFGGGSIWIEGFGNSMPEIMYDMVADVNGDQKADAVIMNQGRWYVALSTGTSFESSGVWLENHYGSLLGDVNGDGKADAVAVQSMGHWSVALSNGNSFDEPVGWIDGLGVDARDKMLGDIDGDGKADAVVFSYEKTTLHCKWEIARSTGVSFGPVETWYEQTGDCSDAFIWMLGDTDADAKSDLILYIHSTNSWYVKRSTGSAFAASKLAIGALGQSTFYPDFGDYPRVTVGDVDGNSAVDFVAYRDFQGIWNTNLCRPEGSAD